MNSRILLLSLSLSFSVPFSIKTFSQSILTYGAEKEVLNLGYKGNTFTGFLYSQNGNHFIVTVRHPFDSTIIRVKNGKSGKTVERHDTSYLANGTNVHIFYRYNSKWEKVSGKVFFHKNRKVDIALLKIETVLPANDLPIGSNGLLLSGDCFIAGYPLGLRMENTLTGDSVHTMPIIKKGIISGMQAIDDKCIFFLIDCNSTYGFSGSPVFVYSPDSKQWQVAAVMAGYFQQTNISYSPDGKKIVTSENSGIAYAYDVSLINQIASECK